jgi:general secretion pathway protein F
MPHFRYRAATLAGKIIVGEVDAPTRAEVIRRIEYLGHLPIEAEIGTPSMLGRSGGLFGAKAPRPREITLFLQQLALLVGAGLTLESALQMLTDDENKSLSKFASTIGSSISAGDSFVEALEHQGSIIEPAYIAMVRAGEASGRLDSVLRSIVDDRTRRERVADRFNSAIRYPLFLVGTAVLILLFFMIFVIPQFEPVFRDLGARLNAGAAFVIAASAWIRQNVDLLLGLGLVAVLSGWLVFSRRAWRARFIAAMTSIPGIAGLMRDRRTVQITGMLGLLLENGVSLPAALKMVRDALPERRLVAALDRVHDQVRNGRRFAVALAETDLLPPLAVRMLKVGDETGDLPSIAAHAAQFYEHKLGIGLDRVMGAIGPVTIVLISIVIGGLILSIMSALLSITELAL